MGMMADGVSDADKWGGSDNDIEKQLASATFTREVMTLAGPQIVIVGVPLNRITLVLGLIHCYPNSTMLVGVVAIDKARHLKLLRSANSVMEGTDPSRLPRPVWYHPWKMYRVISGHLGSVGAIAFDPSNEWFSTGSADRTIKIWDVATGKLQLTLTGHTGQIRGLAISSKHTYMFCDGDDKDVKCWDLTQNKVIRSYPGHLSSVYCLATHPTLDVLLTGGRDSVCRIWDIRTQTHVHAFLGHHSTVCSVFTRPTDPQVVTGSHDSTIKFWDLRGGKAMSTLHTPYEIGSCDGAAS
ncbi:hypothetical protein ACLB2K_042424 [Fragaria x ananassa]